MIKAPPGDRRAPPGGALIIEGDVEVVAHHQQGRTSHVAVGILRTNDLTAIDPAFSTILGKHKPERVLLTVVRSRFTRMEFNVYDSQQVAVRCAVDIDKPQACTGTDRHLRRTRRYRFGLRFGRMSVEHGEDGQRHFHNRDR